MNYRSMLLEVGDLDHLHDENITYAQALQGAGSPAEIIVYPSSKPPWLFAVFQEQAAAPDGDRAVGEGGLIPAGQLQPNISALQSPTQ